MALQAFVAIDDSTLIAMMADSKFRAAFPFLETAQQQLQSHGKPSCCKRTAQIQWAQIMQSVRRQIVSMPDSKKLELRRLLNTNRVRIFASGPRGKVVKYTF